MTEEDTIRLLESRHDIHAVASPAGLTNDPVYQAAVIESRNELAAARADLVQKVAHNTLELSETDTERAHAQQQLAEAVEHYRYYRGRTEDALLNPPPGQPLGPEEFNRRQRLFGRYYEQNPSELVRLSLNKQVEVLDALLSAYQTEAELQNLNHLVHLEATFRPAIDAVQEYHRETHEDLVATETLQQARQNLGRPGTRGRQHRIRNPRRPPRPRLSISPDSPQAALTGRNSFPPPPIASSSRCNGESLCHVVALKPL